MTRSGSDNIGQVLEASVRRFQFGLHGAAVSAVAASAPTLGSVVATGEPGAQAFAVVVEIATTGVDGRRPALRTEDGDGHERIIEANPHLRHVLETTCEALIVGHEQGGRLLAYLPPSPPRIWDGVAFCGADGRRRLFADDFDALRPLVAAGPEHDDATAALVRDLAAGAPDAYAFRVSAGKALARLLAADPQRLAALLRRIRPAEVAPATADPRLRTSADV